MAVNLAKIKEEIVGSQVKGTSFHLTSATLELGRLVDHVRIRYTYDDDAYTGQFGSTLVTLPVAKQLLDIDFSDKPDGHSVNLDAALPGAAL